MQNTKSIPRQVLWLWVSLSVFFCLIMSRVFSGLPTDFYRYWAAFQILLRGGNPYQLANLESVSGFIWAAPPYANPICYLILSPILVWPLPVAWFLWTLCNTALLFCVIFFTWNWASSEPCPWKILVGGTAFFLPVVFNILSGQFALLSALGLSASLYYSKAKSEWKSGIFLSLILIKPHILHLILVLTVIGAVQNKRYRFLISFTVAAILLHLGAALIFPGIYAFWLAALHQSPHHMTTTLPTLIYRIAIIMDPSLNKSIFLFVTPFISNLCAVIYTFKRKVMWCRDLPVLILISILSAPYGLLCDIALLTIPLILSIQTYFSYKPSHLGPGLLTLRMVLFHQVCWFLWLWIFPKQDEYIWLLPLTLLFWLWSFKPSFIKRAG